MGRNACQHDRRKEGVNMCGIAGVYSSDHSVLSKIQGMTEVQAHRGPDGVGHLLLGTDARWGECVAPSVKTGDFLALGHRRLAILDCTPAGAQPMASSDQRDWISYNGEIYNYLELRQELGAQGFCFRTGTDTEVVLAAYRAWGVHCFERFNGMWAIALWDGAKGQLVLSRDRFGVKPLFFAQTSNALVFASEIKGILASGQVQPRLNKEVAIDFLKWSMVNHRYDSFFDGIHSLPPGHFAVIGSLQNTAVRAKPFWTLSASEAPTPLGMEEASECFAELFRDAVRLRLRSDVPVGSCLSGGLDSSAIVCQANALRGPEDGPFHTFNSASNDPRFDERVWCRTVNERVGAVSHFVFPSAEKFELELESLIWHQEEPFTTASIYAQWQVMQAARFEGIPVLLDGQGADEAMCGYRKFYLFHLRDLLRKRHFWRFAEEIVGLIRRGDRGLLRWREGVRYLPTFLQRHVPQASLFLQPGLELSWAESQLPLTEGTSVAHRQSLDLMRFSVPSLLRYEDRNSMAWSIESRVPFLDYRLVDWLVSVPADIKMSAGQSKAVMRHSMKKLVPDSIVNRRDKMGFVTAQEVWLRGELRHALESCFSEPDCPLEAIVNSSEVLAEYRRWLKGASNMSHNDFFKLFVLARWMRSFDVHC